MKSITSDINRQGGDVAHALLVTSDAGLARASKAWRRQPVLALDTEFLRERTYYAILGLVQVSDGHSIWLVDPLEIKDMSPLVEVLADPDCVKVLHSPSEDLEVFQTALGVLPTPLFDTQVAAACLGQTLQMSYTGLIEWLFDIVIDKDQTRSDWTRRPLSEQQLRYAALDVAHLRQAHEQLQNRLAESGRLAWAAEENRRILDKARAIAPPESIYQRVRGAASLSGAPLSALQALAAWRERMAQRRDRPRGFILSDAGLMALARMSAVDLDSADAVEGIHPRALQRHRREWVALIRDARSQPPPEPVPSRLEPARQRQIKQLSAEVRHQAEVLQIDPTLLATRKDLEAWIRNGVDAPPDRFDGWRGPILLAALRELMNQ